MTILVTGGAGYIGSHMVLALLERGEEVIVLDDLSTGIRALLPPEVSLILGDIGDEVLLDRLFVEHTIDSVIHFAAKIVVPDSLADPLGYYDNNTIKAHRLIRACTRHAVRHFIFSSTAAVYGDTSGALVEEETPQNPVSPYGRSKLMVEWMLRDTAIAHGLNTVVLRYFNVAGADPLGRAGQIVPNSTHLIKVAVETALGLRSHMQVFGTDYPTADGTCIRDYVHVCDLVSAHLAALDHLRQGHQGGHMPFSVYNCGYGHGASVFEVIDSVKRVSGVDFKVETTGRRAGDPATVIASGRALRDILGWQPQHHNLDTIIADALRWERKRSNLQPLSRGI